MLRRIKINRRLRLILVTIILACLSYLLGVSDSPQLTQLAQTTSPGLYEVSAVLDGDTIQVEMAGQTDVVRLIGIDTPETHDPRKPVQCFGHQAAAAAERLINGSQVRLEAEPASGNRDKYHRLLRYVYLPDGRLLNEELIRQGYAFAYTIFPFSKMAEFRQLELEAMTQSRGLWADCPVDESSEVKQTAPEMNP